MRISIVCSSPGIGLVPNPVYLATYFKQQKHDVHAITGCHKEYETGLGQVLRENEIPIHYVNCIDSTLRSWIPSYNKLRVLLRQIEPDAIHFWGPRSAFQGRSLSQQTKAIRCAMIGSMGHTKGNSISVRFAAAIANQYLDSVMALCQTERDRLLRAGIKKEKLGVMHFPIACKQYLAYADPVKALGKNKIFSKFKVPSKKRIIGCFAHFHPHKGHEILISAFAKIASEFPDWDLVLGGDGIMIKRCRTLANLFPDRIHFLGRIPHDDVMRLLPLCDAAVHPSLVETYGFSIIEPLLFGLPSVVTRVGIAHEIERDRAALVVAPNNEDALSEGLRLIFEEDTTVTEMAAQSQEYVLRTFDIPIIGDKIISLYSHLLEER